VSVQAQSAECALDELERLFDTSAGAQRARTARDAAHRRALSLLDAREADPRVARIALLDFAADILAALAVELAAKPLELSVLIDKIETVADVPRVELGREVLRSPHLLGLPVEAGIEVQLALLLAFTDARAASLWTMWTDRELKNLGHTGAFRPNARQTRRLACALLSCV
jgi:hypothetical protein